MSFIFLKNETWNKQNFDYRVQLSIILVNGNG